MANFYSIITNRGKELEAEALASGTKITLVKFVVGDGNGQATLPKPTQTKLVNEKYRGDIGDLSVSPDQSTQMMAKIVLPTDVGGFTVREIGILTDAGELYAVANCAAIEKPVGGVSVNMQFRLAVSDTANITLNVSTGDGLFLRIDQDLSEIRGRGVLAQKAARESLAIVDASTKQKGLVQLNSATNSTSEIQAATPAAVKAANDNANGRLEKNKNLSDVPDKSKARANLELIKQTSPTDTTNDALMTNGAWGLGASGVGMLDSDILSPTSIGNTFFNQGGGAANNHFGSHGTGIHLSYGSSGDNSQRLTANLFVDGAGNLSVEWLAVIKSNGAIARQYIQKLYGPLNKPEATDNDFVSKANGGTYNSAIAVKADSRAITLYPKTKDSAACYLIQRNNDETPQWYVGRGTDGGYNVSLHNYAGGGTVTLVADGTITLSNYSAFDARYQAKGSYTPAGQAYTKAESDGRFQPKGSYTPAGQAYTKAESDTRYAKAVPFAGAGGVGTYTLVATNITQALTFGKAMQGAKLAMLDANQHYYAGSALAGTWIWLGHNLSIGGTWFFGMAYRSA